MPKAGSSDSPYTVGDSEPDDDDFSPDPSPSPPPKRPRISKGKAKVRSSIASHGLEDIRDIEDSAGPSRRHGEEYHDMEKISELQEDLLTWFEGCREKRGMPWRKKYDPNLSDEEKGQRAYEIWVSEVMLQQTQVATVIAYFKRWIERWPTIADLAKADIEEVNSAWRGLGYYRRAKSLLTGAQTVMGNSKFKGEDIEALQILLIELMNKARLPSDPVVLEKEIAGVGRYTAGAICSQAYGTRVPLVDGNVHRLFTRLFALHAPQTAPATIKFLWKVATRLVDDLPVDQREGIAGDWNQALMELGSQVCKPVGPDCGVCPIQKGCKAYSELTVPPPSPLDDECPMCEPVPRAELLKPSVTIFPMRKEKKTSREEEEVVSVVEWRGESSKWLFTKRPETGLLAGLFQPPTSPIESPSTATQRSDKAKATIAEILNMSASDLQIIISSQKEVAAVPHIFSHINMIYHVIHVVLIPPEGVLEPPKPRGTGVWLEPARVESANVGTGVKKVWKAVYGAWGSFDVSKGKNVQSRLKQVDTLDGKANGKISKTTKRTSDVIAEPVNGKIHKKIMMPTMPKKSQDTA